MNAVLAAIDFSPVSRAVLEVASELARAIRGRVVMINAASETGRTHESLLFRRYSQLLRTK